LSFRSAAEESAVSGFPKLMRLIRQKYFSKRRKIFDTGKVSVKTPQIATNSPQPHRDLPSKKHQKTQKPPAKAALHHARKIFCKIPQKPVR
jgi:hypothetical protein